MIKMINNIWTMIKMMVIFLIMLITLTFVGTEKIIETGLIIGGFYVGYKMIDLLSFYLKNKIQPTDKVEVKEEEKINSEVVYVEGLINEINKKVKKTVQDKNNLDLLKIKLKQLKNV